MAYTLNRRLAELIDSNGQLVSGKISNGYISTDHLAGNSITQGKLHSTFALPASALSGLNTSNLSESGNLYYTDARVQSYVNNNPISGTTATASGGTNTTALASTAFVQQELTTLIGGAPSTLNDLNELAAAINDDANYNTTLTTALATKLPLAGGTMTGTLNITQASTADTIKLTRSTTSHNNMIKFRSAGADKWIVGQRNDSTEHFRFYSYGTSSDVLSILTNGNVGIGTDAPANKLHVKAGASGASTFDSRYNLTLEDDGENYIGIYSPSNSFGGLRFVNASNSIRGYLDYYHGSQGDKMQIYAQNEIEFAFPSVGEQVTFKSGGSSDPIKVGIGTSSPVSKLNVGTANATAISISSPFATGNYGDLVFTTEGTTTYNARIRATVPGNGTRELSFITAKSASENTVMTLDGNGNVGIGAAPHAGWYGNATALQIATTGALYNTSNWEDLNLANNVYINTSGVDSYIQNDAACKIRLTDAGLMDFRVAGAGTAGNAISWDTAFTISALGRVGVGLTQADPVKFEVNSGTDEDTVMRIRFADDNNSNATANPFSYEYKNLEIENNYSGAAPSANGTKVAKLQLTTVTAGGYAASSSIMGVAESNGHEAGAMVFATGPNSSGLEVERMRISRLGNVGIGTTAPASQLHMKHASGPTLTMTRTSTNTSGSIGEIIFGNGDWDSSMASIRAIQDGTNDGGKLEFKTQLNATAAEQTRFTIFKTGLSTFTGPASTVNLGGGSVNSAALYVNATSGHAGELVQIIDKNNAEQFHISNAGKVAIGAGGGGTSGTHTKLEVHGAIAAGSAQGTGGSLVLYQRYGVNDMPATLSTHYSNSYWLLATGMKARSGAGGYVSSIGNYSTARAGIDVNNSSIKFLYVPAATVAVDTVVTPTTPFDMNLDTGTLMLTNGASGTSNGIVFKETNNSDLNKYIKQTAYYMQYNGHPNEGHHFTTSGSQSQLRIHGPTNGTRPSSVDVTATNGLYVNNAQRIESDGTMKPSALEIGVQNIGATLGAYHGKVVHSASNGFTMHQYSKYFESWNATTGVVIDVLETSNDTANWNGNKSIIIEVRQSSYNGGGYARYYFNNQYDENSLETIDASAGADSNTPLSVTGLTVVTGNIKKSKVQITLGYYQQAYVTVYSTMTTSSSITAANQLRFL